MAVVSKLKPLVQWFNWEADAQRQQVEIEIRLVKEQCKVNAEFCNLNKTMHI